MSRLDLMMGRHRTALVLAVFQKAPGVAFTVSQVHEKVIRSATRDQVKKIVSSLSIARKIQVRERKGRGHESTFELAHTAADGDRAWPHAHRETS